MPHIPNCPDCGHEFSLFDLRHMAMGDNWQRRLWVIDAAGVKKIVTFDELDTQTMRPLGSVSASAGTRERSA